MDFEGSFGRFAGLRRNGKVIVDCDGLDADGFTYPNDAAIDGSSIGLTIKTNVAP